MAQQPAWTKTNQIDDSTSARAQELSPAQKGIVLARLGLGGAWAVAAYLKWQPAFIKGFADTVSGAASGQPAPVQGWITLWSNLIHINPTLFAYGAASIETLLALCFLLGLFTNAASVIGILWSLIIWSVAEGFGGPYVAGQSTDIGTGFPYAILCLVMLCLSAGLYFGLDRILTPRLGRFSILAGKPLFSSKNPQ